MGDGEVMKSTKFIKYYLLGNQVDLEDFRQVLGELVLQEVLLLDLILFLDF